MSKVSKFLSFVLLKDPASIGLSLDKQGWVDVDALLAALEKAGKGITLEGLEATIQGNNRKRFAFDETGSRIRAIPERPESDDDELVPTEPPPYLYHGIAPRFLGAILRGGIYPEGGRKVHLSRERQTAVEVGRRSGKPTILTVDALAMHKAGLRFFCLASGVWLTKGVPSEFVTLDPKT